MSTAELFRQATILTGSEYLEAEAQLRKQGAAAAATLRSELQNADEVDQLMAKTLLDWIEGRGKDIEPALQYLESLPVKIAKTAMGTPSPLGAADYLELKHGTRVAEILALRLVKEKGWRNWKIGAVLLYLEKAKAASTNGAVIRFALESNDPDFRETAERILIATQDPSLVNKLRKERDRLRATNREFPEFLNRMIPEN